VEDIYRMKRLKNYYNVAQILRYFTEAEYMEEFTAQEKKFWKELKERREKIVTEVSHDVKPLLEQNVRNLYNGAKRNEFFQSELFNKETDEFKYVLPPPLPTLEGKERASQYLGHLFGTCKEISFTETSLICSNSKCIVEYVKTIQFTKKSTLFGFKFQKRDSNPNPKLKPNEHEIEGVAVFYFDSVIQREDNQQQQEEEKKEVEEKERPTDKPYCFLIVDIFDLLYTVVQLTGSKIILDVSHDLWTHTFNENVDKLSDPTVIA